MQNPKRLPAQFFWLWVGLALLLFGLASAIMQSSQEKPQNKEYNPLPSNELQKNKDGVKYFQ